MEKIELKHLACYLPYGLKIMAKIESQIENHPFEHCDIVNVNLLSKSLTIRHMVGIDKDVEYITYKNFEDIKPILRPLSDYKDVNEDAMVNLNIDISDQLIIADCANGYFNPQDLMYRVAEICFENHIDVFGLIDKGLAIDINTLK